MPGFPNSFRKEDPRLVEALSNECDRLRKRIGRGIPRAHRAVLQVDDVLQQSCVEAFAAIEDVGFKSRQHFSAWFETVARRNLIDAIRALQSHKRGGQATRLALHSEAESLVGLLDCLVTTSITASRQLLFKETVGRLRAAIACLPDHYRQVIELYDLKQQPIEQVAQAMHKTIGATFMIRNRAHRLLAEMLQTTATA